MKLKVGDIYLRSQLHQSFGGNPRAGICPTRAGVVLIFSDKPSGEPFGYHHFDFVRDGVYHYTGEGRIGDQQFLRGNRAVMERELLLFSRIDAKSWVFVGDVKLGDPAFLYQRAPDQNGAIRNVIVFRFVPLAADFNLLAK